MALFYGKQWGRVSKPKFVKMIWIVGLLFDFFVGALFAELRFALARTPHGAKQRRRAKRVSTCSANILAEAGFKVELKGFELIERLLRQGTGFLLVSNHLSFWDVLFISSKVPTLFITSVEVRNQPFLGWLAILGGSTFVERRNRKGIDGEISQIRAELKEGRPVVLFPEGTSGDGAGVLPFKRSLFRAAVQAEVPVIVTCINYLSIDQEPLSSKNRDHVFYYGDQTFFDQFIKIFSLKEIRVGLDVLGALVNSDQDHGHRQLAEQSFEMVNKAYRPIGFQ